MPDDNQEVSPAAKPEQPKPQPPNPATDPARESDTDWKAEARKWETRAKENKAAIDDFAKLRDGLKSALGVEDKHADAADLTARMQEQLDALRRENLVEKVARRHKIDDDDDLYLLQSAADEQAMEKLAARLAPKGDDSGKSAGRPKPDSSQGRGGDGSGGRPGSVAEVMEQRRAEREKRQSSKSA